MKWSSLLQWWRSGLNLVNEVVAGVWWSLACCRVGVAQWALRVAWRCGSEADVCAQPNGSFSVCLDTVTVETEEERLKQWLFPGLNKQNFSWAQNSLTEVNSMSEPCQNLNAAKWIWFMCGHLIKLQWQKRSEVRFRSIEIERGLKTNWSY